MNITELKEVLTITACDKGICTEGRGKLSVIAEKDALVEYYTENPDWCLERDFPHLRILRSEFGNYEDKGVFVGKTFKGETLCGLQTYVFHNCKGTVKVAMDYDKAIIPMLYLANGCRLRITCDQKENAGKPIKVPVYVFGKNDVSARSNKYAIFIIYKHEMI